MAVHLSIETGRRLYISKKENSYLDEVNEKYFRPRGLYAMIVSPAPVKDTSITSLQSIAFDHVVGT